MITVEGKKYKVTESLGFQNGHYAKRVEVGDQERVVVRAPGGRSWRFWTPKDRLAPLFSVPPGSGGYRGQ